MLKDQMRAHLTGCILPFWESLKDERHGGFFGYMDRDLNVLREADKGCILNSRILWTFSTAAGALNDETAKRYADHAYGFLSRFEDAEHGGMYWSVTHNGVPSDTTKHTYCQAFAVYGLAAYYRLTGNREALEKAVALYRLIEEKCRDAGGYGEAFRADFSPESNEKLSENGVMAGRTMNTLLHVLEAYTELYRVWPDPGLRSRGRDALACFLNVIYNNAKHRLDVFFDPGFRPLLDMQSYGHDIEASWLLWDSVTALLPENEQAPYRAMCLDLADSVCRRAFTDHGLKNECVDGQDDELRIWWVQAETMLGFANAYALTKDSAWLDRLITQWTSIRRMILDKRPGGEWYWSVFENGEPTERPIVEQWKCPYHNGRMCLKLMEADLPVQQAPACGRPGR